MSRSRMMMIIMINISNVQRRWWKIWIKVISRTSYLNRQLLIQYYHYHYHYYLIIHHHSHFELKKESTAKILKATVVVLMVSWSSGHLGNNNEWMNGHPKWHHFSLGDNTHDSNGKLCCFHCDGEKKKIIRKEIKTLIVIDGKEASIEGKIHQH